LTTISNSSKDSFTVKINTYENIYQRIKDFIGIVLLTTGIGVSILGI